MVERETVVETGLAMTLTRGRAPRTFRCRIISGDGDGRQVSVTARPVRIGAENGCDLVLSDPKVSRQHAELRATESGIRVVDLDSTNGVFVDGVRVADAVFPPGCTVRCGDTKLRVTAIDAPVLTPSGRARFGGLVGTSLVMRELFAVLELASPTSATVLIEGESGTGKELVARAIHDHSDRADRPLIIVDCSAANENLIESQLFGHKRGAFTGADGDRKGAFVEADGGTLFLDELGELPLRSQARLLRALEAGTVQPLGSDAPVRVDTRVIAATNRNLVRMVERQEFRFDLFHRLSVVHVALPALRERVEDIPALVEHFYEGRGLEPGAVSGENLEKLQSHGWPGNVRELRNCLERALVLSGPQNTSFDSLTMWLGTGAVDSFDIVQVNLPFKDAKERWVQSFERRYLASVYHQHDRNVTRAAKAAGVTRHHFRELLNKHGIRDERG